MADQAMSQEEVNDAEWRNPTNWRGRWFRIYHSELDTRAWVPKPDPRMGMTVNFARRSGVMTIALILAIALGVVLLAILSTT